MAKKFIKIAVNREFVNTVEREIELPEVAKYYCKEDEGRFFPRGTILFAILPKYPHSDKGYLLVQVERNKQDFNDFVPTEDCRDSGWLNKTGLRQTAFEIFQHPQSLDGFTEITEQEFNEKRNELLNAYKK